MISDKELFIILTSTNKLHAADAAILLQGDGLTRINHSCKLLNDGWAKYLVFSGGADNLAYGSYSYAKCYPHLLASGISTDKIIWENESQHTRQQAESVVRMCIENKWSRIILVGTHYHQYRAFLTFLKVLIEQNLQQVIVIINSPVVDVNWFELDSRGSRVDLLEDEFKRIELYKANGHIAEYREAIDYYKWRELQLI